MKRVKKLIGIATMATLVFAGASSFTEANSNENLKPQIPDSLRLRSCPVGMAGYRCIWTTTGDNCPVNSRYPIAVYNCNFR
jgi:hypothetical protein